MSKPEKIIAAARQRFRYYGIGKTTMQEIAQDAGVAVGTLYLYFSNKDDLIVACAEEFIDHHRKQITAVLESNASADDKLRDYLLARFRQAEEVRAGSRHAVEIARAVLRVKPDRLRDEGIMMWDTIVKILESGIAQGSFQIANPRDDAKVFLYSTACFFPNALSEPVVPLLEEDLLMVVRWFIGVWKSTANKANGRKRVS